MLAALLLLASPMPVAAGVPASALRPQSATVNHCIDAAGGLIYTDRPCTAVGARAIDDDGLAQGPFTPAYRSGCIRSLHEFAFELSSAIEVGDVNRLAALYRWKGTSTRIGYGIMDRLEEIVARPLLQVEPVYPALPAPLALPAPPGPPAALRLDQTLPDGVTPAATTLRLERESGCWWVSL